jgi:hypothetical protein
VNLYRQAIEPYELRIESNALLTALHASFDGEVTWVAGESVETTAASTDPKYPYVSEWRWVIASATAASPPAGAVIITADVRPMLQAASGPYKVIRPSAVAINVV